MAELTIFGNQYREPQGRMLRALHASTPGATCSVENKRRKSDRRPDPTISAHKCRPKKLPVSTKST
jgi:hypothetical protein